MLHYIVLSIMILTIIYVVKYFISISKQDQTHHDSRKGSFYEISNRRQD